MVTFAQAQERAEEWINGDVPAYQHREVRVREFDLGFVVWAEDREDGPRSDGGRQRLVIARGSGETTLWPALPVGEVIRRYEEAYGVVDAAQDTAEPAKPERVDLNQTSFLLTPPEWLQEAADRMGIPDRREAGSGASSGASAGAASGASASPAPGSPVSGSPVSGPSASGAPAPAASASSASSVSSDSSGGTGPGSGSAAPSPIPTPAPAPANDRAQSGSSAAAPGGTAWPSAGGAEPAAPESATPWAGTDTNGADQPATMFAPPLSGSDDDSDTPPPAAAPEAKTALMSGGSQLPPTAVSPAIDGPDPSYGYPQQPGGPGQATPPPAQGTAPPAAPAAPSYVHPQRPAPGQPAAPGAPRPPAAPGAGADDIANAATSKAAPPRAARGSGASTPAPPGAPGTPGARPGAAPPPPSAPGAPGAGNAYVPTQMVSSLGPDGPQPPGPPAPPAGGSSGGGVHHAATMLAGPDPSGPAAPQPPGPPGAPGAGAPQPPGPPGVPGGTPPGGVHHAATMLAGPDPSGPAAPQPPGPPGAPGSQPPGAHHAATMLAGPGGPGTPAPPGPPGPPPGVQQPAGPGPQPAYGYPQQPSGLPTVGPGYQVVVSYRAPDGSQQQLIRRSAPGTPHPEWQIFHELRGMNVPADQVLEIHTELESCDLPGGYCARMIKEQWPQARITTVAPYGADHASRQQGMQLLLGHQGELHQVADGPARLAPVRAPLPPVQPAPPVGPDVVGQELAGAFGPQGVFRFDQRAVSRQGVPEVVATTLVWAGLPVDFNPFFWAQAQPGRPVPTLAELAQERGVQPASDAGSYLVMGSDFGRAICVQYGTAHIVAVPVESGPGGAPVPPQFVNSGLPEFARCLAMLGRMWRLRYGLNQEQAGRWTVDFQAQLAALDPAALSSPETWWSVLLEQMWDGLL
ncbi:SUKH-4 family immunity protein [Streptomyces sp. TRM66268-LWL]|uniref:SUKH-4 family immunity protein n=1 Tax=Streptomyces polyasparticus TaxID=2767826 RepID=A0ABR7SQ12_9ACTN|nr:SUKH-4 family immunity protein [Streptomyces polyasparticus]MBC9716770.1 SUKH-4 family immunity protein [Streptomyces polyasparticus]